MVWPMLTPRAYRRRLHRAFLESDVKWAVKQGKKIGLSKLGAIGGFHKARLAALDVPDHLRMESADYLRSRNLKGYGGVPLPEKPEDLER